MGGVHRAADVAAYDGRTVTVRGTYAVIDMGRYRATGRLPDGTVVTVNRIARIELADGGYVELGIRPDAELAAMDGRRVAATGLLTAYPARLPEHVAQPDSAPTLSGVRVVAAEGDGRD